ncbi:MAG: GTPase family protein, partial [bacterium]
MASIEADSDEMPRAKRFRDVLSKAIFTPKISDTKLAEKLDAVKQTLPMPVIWLLGKAQSGKSALIRALTGRDDAAIGNGFQPCTRTARLYDFPDTAHCFVRFLDTRGLGEVDYDPTEDMRLFGQQAHLLMVVMRAMDHAQQEVLQALRAILKQHPGWPVIVVQTTLHEGYPDRATQHLDPYPYASTPWPPTVPKDLARSLLQQREWFAHIEAAFVALDFTLPEDGYAPVLYGLDALWAAIEAALPLGLRALFQSTEHMEQLRDIYARTAHPHILTYAVLAGGLEAIPIPMVSVPFVLSLQAKMLQAIASIYNQELNRERYAEIA